MASGVIDFSAGPTRIYSRLARNLNSGDNIYLVLATYSTAPVLDILSFCGSYPAGTY